MTLKELFGAARITGCVILDLIEEGVKYECSDGYDTVTERDCDEEMPDKFAPYADGVVSEMYPDTACFSAAEPDRNGISRSTDVPAMHVKVFATPDPDKCEVYYTGGGIWCGTCRVADGWFFGETNSWGGIWKTYSQAVENFAYEENGFIRYVSDVNELRDIWTHIYGEVIRKGGYDADYCKVWLETLDADLSARDFTEELE